MDSSVLLDYALFQLTPTRTRCDLIVFYGAKPEKLASGLCEPFVSHLKFAKDEFSKGGYSIKLYPPFRYAPWFTKSTFQRFVRFISTPAVLERFVKLESEILQIDESSAEANESLCRSGEPEEGRKRNEKFPSPPPQENSKVQFRRLLETRKSMLRREQAMAYARGLVAGFEPDKLDDLISFADAFGASRLKQACVNFKELCKKKNGDGLWMKELAAMEAYSPAELAFSPASGIVLTNEAMDGSVAADSSPARQSSLDSQKDETATATAQMGMPWPNQMIPPYMYNFQQLNHPYQGYPYPPMQPFPPQYAMNMQSPPTSRRKSSPAKQHSRKGRGYSTEDSEEEESSGSESMKSDSESEIRPDKKQQQLSSPGDNVPVKKKHHRRKSSSKTVVIRNINYITSKKRNGASDDSFSGEDEGKLVNEVVESLEKKMNVSKTKKDNWDAFQNLLMRDEGPQEPGLVVAINGAEFPVVDLESPEKLTKQRIPAGDSFLLTKADDPLGDRVSLEEDVMVANRQGSIVKKRMDSADEDLVISRGVYESGTGLITDENLSSSTVKPGKGGEDWFVIKGSVNNEANFNGDYLQMESSNSGKRETTERDRLAVDDSFMLEARPLDVAVNHYDESPWRTDIVMATDLSLSSRLDNGDMKERRSSHGKPVDDLCMVVEREAAWCTDQSMDISFMEAATDTTRKSTNTKTSEEENQSNSTKLETKNKKNATANHNRVPGRTRTEIMNSRTKRTTPLQSRPLIQKSKLEREEEARKKIEELALQRQKRIAERTAASKGKSSIQKQNPN